MARRHLGVEPQWFAHHRGGPMRGVLCQDADQRIEELRLSERLREIGGEERLVGAGFAPAERAEQHERQRGAALADLPRKCDPVHFGHVHVDDH